MLKNTDHGPRNLTRWLQITHTLLMVVLLALTHPAIGFRLELLV